MTGYLKLLIAWCCLWAVPAQAATTLTAEPLAAFPAREAGQGAAVDAGHFYAIVNTAIGKYDRTTGERVGGWSIERGGPIVHLNSCYARENRLLCAHSNFPQLPMASSIEIFDTERMVHVASESLGLRDGSLTWFDRHDGSWWAGFAHYDDKGGMPGRDHRFSNVARFDDDWQLLEQWLLPESVQARMAPHAASGGAFGPDGLLYLTGHDRKELYAVQAPKMGVRLEHVATISVDLEGQAFAWEPGSRVIWGISRPNREVRAFRIPTVRE